MPTTTFYSGTDWEQSSGPFCNRYFELADLWPQGTGAMGEIDGGDKDVLAAGEHPVLAIGAKANRRCNLTGVVVDYEDANRVLMNVAHCMIVRQYVANILTYSGGSAATWATSVDAGDCVYVDDSGPLAAGVTLSLVATNESSQENPKAGYIMYCQDDYDDSNYGGRDQHGGGLPHTGLSSTSTEYFLACILLTPDSG
jgi:hypothetical protein